MVPRESWFGDWIFVRTSRKTASLKAEGWFGAFAQGSMHAYDHLV